MTVAATLIIATSFSDDAAAQSGGFMLKDTDAAHAEWVLTNLSFGGSGDPCDLSVAVGFVKARQLKLPLNSKGHPHSDLAATMTGNCATDAASFDLEGVLPLIPTPGACTIAPTITELDLASVTCSLTLTGSTRDDAVALVAVLYIDLGWMAFGDAINENFSIGKGHKAKHMRKAATITGSVQIMSLVPGTVAPSLTSVALDDTNVLTVVNTTTTPHDISPVITHYNEKQAASHH